MKTCKVIKVFKKGDPVPLDAKYLATEYVTDVPGTAENNYKTESHLEHHYEVPFEPEDLPESRIQT